MVSHLGSRPGLNSLGNMWILWWSNSGAIWREVRGLVCDRAGARARAFAHCKYARCVYFDPALENLLYFIYNYQ